MSHTDTQPSVDPRVAFETPPPLVSHVNIFDVNPEGGPLAKALPDKIVHVNAHKTRRKVYVFCSSLAEFIAWCQETGHDPQCVLYKFVGPSTKVRILDNEDIVFYGSWRTGIPNADKVLEFVRGNAAQYNNAVTVWDEPELNIIAADPQKAR